MSVVQITDQTNCGRAGTQRGTSDACAACSGCGEDHGNMRRTRWRVRIESGKDLFTSGNAAQASGPPGRGSYLTKTQDGAVFTIAAIT